MENTDNDYETYCNELISLSAIFTNTKQLSYELDLSDLSIPNINNEAYNKTRSLLMLAETDDFVEFNNGKPNLLVKYISLIVIGSSKNMLEPTGSAPMDDHGIDIDKCNFYTDYLIRPFQICKNNSCNTPFDVTKNKFWCTKCHGFFKEACQLFSIVRKSFKFTEMPRNSVLRIFKKTEKIDYNNVDHLIKVKKFLDIDKMKIETIQARIDKADAKMKQIIDLIQIEKKINQEKINSLLLTRGGSMEEYHKTIEEINQQLNYLK